MVIAEKELDVHLRLPIPHDEQVKFLESKAKRKIIRAGRRGGKTVGCAILGVQAFIKGKRVLYAAPTGEQTDTFWREVTKALRPLIETGYYKLNEGERFIERIGTENRIKAKTAWNPDTLRGDYADVLILDEWQLMDETTWGYVGAPMLMDNNGDAVFVYTPPSLRGGGISRAKDPRHASKMFAEAKAEYASAISNKRVPRWEAFHFTSFDNPNLSEEALADITLDMTRDSYLKEILAEDDEAQANLLVYGDFDEKVCKIKRFEIPKDWPVFVGHDFGSANPAALFVAKDPSTGFFYCFNEYLPPKGLTTYQNVQEFKRIISLPGELGKESPQTYNIINRVGGNITTEDEIRQGYGSQGWPITAPYITKVFAQIDRAKSLIEKNKIFIFEDLHHLLEEINTCMWKLDDLGMKMNEIKNEKRYHLLSCVRYLFSIFQPEADRSKEKKSYAGGFVARG